MIPGKTTQTYVRAKQHLLHRQPLTTRLSHNGAWEGRSELSSARCPHARSANVRN